MNINFGERSDSMATNQRLFIFVIDGESSDFSSTLKVFSCSGTVVFLMYETFRLFLNGRGSSSDRFLGATTLQ